MPLTSSDIQFLRGLAKELKNQDTLATPKPVIYKLQTTERIMGFDPSITKTRRLMLINTDHGLEYTDLAIAKDELVNVHYEGGNQRFLSKVQKASCFNEILALLKGYYSHDNWMVTGYKERKKDLNYFLTKRALEEHVESNKNHYTDPSSYIVNAWENDEFTRLLEIVEKFAG